MYIHMFVLCIYIYMYRHLSLSVHINKYTYIYMYMHIHIGIDSSSEGERRSAVRRRLGATRRRVRRSPPDRSNIYIYIYTHIGTRNPCRMEGTPYNKSLQKKGHPDKKSL